MLKRLSIKYEITEQNTPWPAGRLAVAYLWSDQTGWYRYNISWFHVCCSKSGKLCPTFIFTAWTKLYQQERLVIAKHMRCHSMLQVNYQCDLVKLTLAKVCKNLHGLLQTFRQHWHQPVYSQSIKFNFTSQFMVMQSAKVEWKQNTSVSSTK